MKDPRILEIIAATSAGRPADVQTIVHEMIGERVVDMVGDYKAELSANMFAEEVVLDESDGADLGDSDPFDSALEEAKKTESGADTTLDPADYNNDGEKNFVAKHVVVKHENRDGNGENAFKGVTKYIKRKEEGHGHDAGEDHLVYEDFEDLTEAPAMPKGAKHTSEYAGNLAFCRHTKDDAAYNAAVTHLKDLKKHKRLGIPHPKLGRIPKGADIAGAEMDSGKFDFVYDKTKKLNEEAETLDEATIGHFSNAGPFIRITKGTDRVTKKPTRHVEIHNGKTKTRLITSVDPKWDHQKIKDHLMKTHGDKLKPVVWNLNEEVLDEGHQVVTKNYSWGKMKTIHNGSGFSIPMHPEHHEPISKLKDGESHHFTDETRTRWTATRSGDDVHFKSSTGKVKVPHASLNEERDTSIYEPDVKKNFLGLGYHPAIKEKGKDGHFHVDRAIYKTPEGAMNHAKKFHQNMKTHYYGGHGLPRHGDAFPDPRRK